MSRTYVDLSSIFITSQNGLSVGTLQYLFSRVKGEERPIHLRREYSLLLGIDDYSNYRRWFVKEDILSGRDAPIYSTVEYSVI